MEHILRNTPAVEPQDMHMFPAVKYTRDTRHTTHTGPYRFTALPHPFRFSLLRLTPFQRAAERAVGQQTSTSMCYCCDKHARKHKAESIYVRDVGIIPCGQT